MQLPEVDAAGTDNDTDNDAPHSSFLAVVNAVNFREYLCLLSCFFVNFSWILV